MGDFVEFLPKIVILAVFRVVSVSGMLIFTFSSYFSNLNRFLTRLRNYKIMTHRNQFIVFKFSIFFRQFYHANSFFDVGLRKKTF